MARWCVGLEFGNFEHIVLTLDFSRGFVPENLYFNETLLVIVTNAEIVENVRNGGVEGERYLLPLLQGDGFLFGEGVEWMFRRNNNIKISCFFDGCCSDSSANNIKTKFSRFQSFIRSELIKKTQKSIANRGKLMSHALELFFALARRFLCRLGIETAAFEVAKNCCDGRCFDCFVYGFVVIGDVAHR